MPSLIPLWCQLTAGALLFSGTLAAFASTPLTGGAASLNPYAPPAGPIYGASCRPATATAKEQCPRCVEVVPVTKGKPTKCKRYIWYTPDLEKAREFDRKAREADAKAGVCKAVGTVCGTSLVGDKAGKGGVFYNPETVEGKDDPCCKGSVCKRDPLLAVGTKKDLMFCANCTKSGQQCAGVEGKTYVGFVKCCDKAYECVVAPAKGWGKWCMPKVAKVTASRNADAESADAL